MSVGSGDKSTPQSIADALRDDLMDGVLSAGSRLTEESLSERFGSGRHSVRSALQILTSQGLLEHRRNKGIVVPLVTAARIDEMCSYRAILELGALRLALDNGSDFAGVSTAVDRLDSLDATTPWRHIMEAHTAVHEEIVKASGNQRLVAAHAACETELNSMMAIIRGDFTAHRLAIMHRTLFRQLQRGGTEALRGLEDDLEGGGRAAMHAALDRQLAAPGLAAVR
ncbi:MAG TPA: GntR family transcriptional regulator [Galbitalea sp.]